jgi:predicted ABC-type transport system involved in lysophospholipase L1 biosynthesis ATPase subunit
MLRLRELGFVFQTFNLIASMSAAENVALPMILDGRRSGVEVRARAQALLAVSNAFAFRVVTFQCIVLCSSFMLRVSYVFL